MGFKPVGLVRLNRKEFGAGLEIPAAVERHIISVMSQITNSLNIPLFMKERFDLKFRLQTKFESLKCNTTCMLRSK